MILRMAMAWMLVATVWAQEPNELIVKQSERERLYLMTLEKMLDLAKPVHRIDADASRIGLDLRSGSAGYRGEIEPFWRIRALPDRWLNPPTWAISSDKPVIGLLEDFTGRNLSEHPKTALLDEGISCVRFLGGWKKPSRPGGEYEEGTPIESYDLVYRGDDGALKYRWERVHGRLDPLVENGLTPLIVLDNVPHMFAEGEGNPVYGQHLAPNDFEAWGTFIEALCRELADRYGFEKVNQWRFRVGTEMDNPNHWEGGAEDSLVKYLKTYDHAAAAVKRVLPGAKIGPCNFNSMFAGQIDRKVPPMAVFEHFARGTNYATGEIGSPADFAAVSSYGMYWMGGEFDHPLAAAYGYHPDTLRLHADLLKRLRATSPRFADIPIEVHEHGTLMNKNNTVSYEPGAFGAAWTATQYIVGIEEGFAQIFHWADHEGFRGNIILYGHAWLRAVMERFVGGEAWVLPVANATEDAFIDALAVRRDGRLYLMISAYRAEREDRSQETVEIPLPRRYRGAAVRQLRMDHETSPYEQMLRDLKAAGEAKAAIGATGMMATPAGRQMLAGQADRYVEMQRDSFTWKPFEGNVRNRFWRGPVLETPVAVPSVTVLRIE
ncbi:GH39 family glycosyl hydrolase [Kiritimatiella glycovorans]|uniref:Beta-xylosidase n=1 Tax=Kiritimatiella glycovorans TaxID=1307763 RepID=A0A0G3EFU6_9BACT|nr:hypothetical protein [Kiritimatiella glycovorans]AKJ63685.1 Beta-xylosidase [Kiritimatiella glycovorans]